MVTRTDNSLIPYTKFDMHQLRVAWQSNTARFKFIIFPFTLIRMQIQYFAITLAINSVEIYKLFLLIFFVHFSIALIHFGLQ